MRIAVVPEELRSLGSRVTRTGADVTATRGVLMGAVDGAGAATGVPEAAAAYEDMCAAWAGALARAGHSIEAAGAAATGAAALYELVDATVMPLLGGGER
jgi:methylmalonyl-CoA mutase cobalamin-binding subunit